MRANPELAAARLLREPRREAMLALAPLLVIVLGFLTPPIIPTWMWSYGRRLAFTSPYQDGASWMWSIQVVAAMLTAITVVHARRRSEPGWASRIAAAIGTLAVLHMPVVMLVVVGGDASMLALTSAVVVIGAGCALVLAFRARGWHGWLYALGAYAIAALPYACPLWPGVFNEFSGGVIFVAADVTLLVLVVLGLRAERGDGGGGGRGQGGVVQDPA